MSDFTLSCINQRKQRSRFFYHLAGDAASRYNSVSPYIYETSLEEKLVYSQEDLNMRRKAEILKYSTKDYNKQKKQNYSFLAKKHTKARPCPNSNSAKPSSSSGVPGPIIPLFENPNIPLYNYKSQSKQFTFQNIPFDEFKRIFDTFPFYNIDSFNNTYVNLMDIIILNPDNNQFLFNFSIPISLEYTAYFNGISSVYDVTACQIAIFSSILDIMYSDTLISSNNIPYRTNPALDSDIVSSTKSISIDFAESTVGQVKVRQYLGNIILKNVTIQTVTQYVYTLFLKINTNYAEYSGLSPVPATKTKISITSGNNITDVLSLNMIILNNWVNIDDVYYQITAVTDTNNGIITPNYSSDTLVSKEVEIGLYNADNQPSIPPIRDNAGTGESVSNSNAINVTNVSYKYITNFDNTNPNLVNMTENCELVIFDSEGTVSNSEDIEVIPFSISAIPV